MFAFALAAKTHCEGERKRNGETLTRPLRAICHATVDVAGAALHSTKLSLESMDLERMTRDKHLGRESCHRGRYIDKHSARSLGSCLCNRAELPCRRSDVDCSLRPH